MLIWGIVGIAQLFVIVDDQASTHNFAYLSLGIGSFLIGGMSAIAFVQFHLLNDENADEDDEDEVSVEDTRELIPDELLTTWESLREEYDDEDFATWILGQVGTQRGPDEIRQVAARKHLDWIGANTRHDSALHESAHTVVRSRSRTSSRMDGCSRS